MNKNILKNNQNENSGLQKLYDEATKKLEVKSQKLIKYHDIVKTFNVQIKMFEDFQTTAMKEIDQLKSQLSYFRDMHQKEKLEKESLLKRCRPTDR